MTMDTRNLPAETRIKQPIGTVISNLYRLQVPVVEFLSRPENEQDRADVARPGNYAATQFLQRSRFDIATRSIEVWRLQGHLQPGDHANETRLVISAIRLPLARFLFTALALVLAVGIVAATVLSGNPVLLLAGLIPYVLLGLGWFFVQTQMRYIVGRQAKVLENAARGRFPY